MTTTYDNQHTSEFIGVDDDGYVAVWEQDGTKRRLLGISPRLPIRTKLAIVGEIQAALRGWEGWA